MQELDNVVIGFILGVNEAGEVRWDAKKAGLGKMIFGDLLEFDK